MANWLDITNTVINFETLGRVNDLAKAQQQVADQMLAVEYRKLRDNDILSRLVDVIVKVRQLLQDNQFLDSVLSAGIGLLSFNGLYDRIIDAETKLKASDIQVELLETIRTSISAPSIHNMLQTSLSDFFSNFQSSLKQILVQMKSNQYRLIWLDPSKEWEIGVGEEFIPTQILHDTISKLEIFQKRKTYKVFAIDNDKKGFYLIDDFGQKRFMSFQANGGAKYFMFFEPPLSSLENEVSGWELIIKLFANETTLTNLRSIHTTMLNIFNNALEQANVTHSELVENIIQYKEYRQEIIEQTIHQSTTDEDEELQSADSYKSPFAIIIITIIVLIALLRSC
jgi:hypothetical protein